MGLNSLEDLYQDTLRDVLYVEKALVKALPKMAKAATSPDLKAGITEHLEETRGHIERLDEVFKEAGIAARAKTCPAIDGILEEGNEMLAEDGNPMTKDAAIIAAGNRVEHYEIAVYGCLQSWAQKLGLSRSAELLQQTLDEEKEADRKLTELAETVINEESEEEDEDDEESAELESDEEEEEAPAKPAKRGATKASPAKRGR